MPGPTVDGLSQKQERAIAALLREPSVLAAANSCDVGERTLHRWLREPVFAAEYRRRRREAFSQAISLTQQSSASAVATLLRVMHDAGAKHAARVTAATNLLKFARESIEIDDLAARIEQLEKRTEKAT